ncbi:hypothetical protein [Chitinophaga varians]|uniref:hypothetical protein n=1 Tax=Chitinophaga varians TaxID=2202339 RepID=UPI00165F982A|nr:hypothetical protein [Chitinophaga varians]MBC9913140.1 hypothetical protein [Chitinophaga varians]
MNKLTIKQAIEQGYTHCADYGIFQGDDGRLMRIEEMKENYFDGSNIVICERELHTFSIDGELLFELLSEYLEGQEEVGDENGELIDIAATVDFTTITSELNKAFSRKKYYKPTDIQLIYE